MNALLDIDHEVKDSATADAVVKRDIRHVVFDACASHDLQANGVYNVAKRVVAEQTETGHDAKLFFLREEGREIPADAQAVKPQVLVLSGHKVLGKRVSLDSSIMDALTKGAAPGTVFHIHSARQPLLVPLTAALRRRGFRYAMTVHGRYSHLTPEGLHALRPAPIYLRLLERRILQNAVFVQAITQAERDLITMISPHARIELVPNAAYSSRIDGVPPVPTRNQASANYPAFGFIGRYEIGHKGLDLLVEGFALYRASGGTGTLRLIGTGPARERLAELAAELRVSDHLQVDGALFGDDKIEALQGMDYFAMPSRFDVLPTGALEAALNGLPLIVSQETGLANDVVNANAGVGIDALTPQAVAAALKQAEAQPAGDWGKMSKRSYELAVSLSDWSKVSDTLVSLYP